jgi:3-phosphoshikimate 1-carboxyvinyltransferase
MSSMKIRPARRIEGRVRLPGDKSISHRAALVAALATGKSELTNFSTSRDCAATLSCLGQLGISIKRAGNKIQVESNGRLRPPPGPLDCGNSGSTMRMLAGILAGQNFASTLTGDRSLTSRPMERVIAPLEMMGARVGSNSGRAPLSIEGHSPLEPIVYELPIASAQIKTCILFAGLQASGRTKVIEKSGTTRDHTERLLQWFGVDVESGVENSGAASCAIVGPARFEGRTVRVPGDFSTAAFLIAAAGLLPGSELVIEDVGLNPTRTQFFETVQSLGARIEIIEVREDCNERVGTIRVEGDTWVSKPDSSTFVIDGQLIAPLIDELPLLGVVGTQLPGGIAIRDAAELRLKETDRITATVNNLRAMGAAVREYDDGFSVEGPVRLKAARLSSYEDHRIAMAFSIAGLLAEGESEIVGSDCVAVSFPEFFECLESLVKR